MYNFLLTIYRYREYLKQSVARDLKKKYKRSVLGYFWSMLNPLFMMLVLTIVFSSVMGSGIQNYSVFLFSAMLPWSFFSSTINDGLGVIRSNINIISQIPIPKYIFLLSVAFSNLVNFILSLIPLFLVMFFVAQPLRISFVLLPIVMLPLFIFSLSLSMICAVLNTFFEDTQHLVKVILQAVYYLCPILYGAEHLSPDLVFYLRFNPIFPITEMFRDIIYYGNFLNLYSYLPPLLIALVFLKIALLVFNWADEKFMYFT